MKYIEYDPEKHKNVQLYEVQSVEQGDTVAAVIVESNATEEIAQITPWLYLVEKPVSKVGVLNYGTQES